MNLEELQSYELLEKKKIEELNSMGYILKHKKSGANLFLLSNDDENKVFTIGFRTPPTDSTGLPHILEHSVLCGSKKFPAKDPFVELVKGSLNTFLNAMTYPDKTLYPVASCNEKDFQNLMDVYMDAVLNPNIYKEKKIFEQEGWHYELESQDAPLTYNGVVYNEMKGAFSSPESVLDRYTRNVLFPETAYSNESGGDPDVIVDLTYEDFLKFHSKYYHPSNSYIYLYGNMDMVEKLQWLDSEYLKDYDKMDIDSKIGMQEAFQKPVEREIFYSITEVESEKDATYLSLNTVVGTDLDPVLYVAFQILEYALLSSPGAPLKQALIDAGVGKDVFGGYDNGILQPYFSVVAKGANKEQKGEFLVIIKGLLRKIADTGINKRSLLAGINFYEFKYREADYGAYPKGLMYGLQCFDSWLYDSEPMMHLSYQKTFDFLKEQLDNGYFETIIQTYLLDNFHEAFIIVSPKKNLTTQLEAELSEKLKAHKATLSSKEIEELIKNTTALKEYQDKPSTKEELEAIPLLSRSDIGKEPNPFYIDEKIIDGTTVVHHNMFTSGIGYLKLLFNTNKIADEDLVYVGLLKSVLGYINTEHFTYSELSSEIHINSGGINIGMNVYANLEQKDDFYGMFEISARVLYNKLGFGFEMIEEILFCSILEDEKRMAEIIAELRSRSQMRLNNNAHSAALSRAASYFSPTSCFNELTGGISFYQFLEKIEKEYAERKSEIIAKLKAVMAKLFTKENLLVSYTADEEGFDYLQQPLIKFSEKLNPVVSPVIKRSFLLENKNEGFKTSSKVNYVARSGDFISEGLEYTGVLKILKVILSYDYLWLNIRVKGGAYGCMSGFGRTGEGYFVSYRDPNLAETNEIYKGIVDYLKNFIVDERDMTKYVIGTVSDLDTPLNPSSKGSRSLSAYLSKVNYEMLLEERSQILNAQIEDIRNLASIAEAILKTGSFCVVGNEDKIEANKQLFHRIENLSSK